MKNTVVLPLQEELVKSKAPVVEKWSTMLQGTKTPNMAAVASFLLSIPVTNTSIVSVFPSVIGMDRPTELELCGADYNCKDCRLLVFFLFIYFLFFLFIFFFKWSRILVWIYLNLN